MQKVVTDHLGNRYNSAGIMCRKYGISYQTFNSRLKLGWSLKDSLTIPVSKRNVSEVEDHLGNIFHGVREMCVYYGLDIRTYQRRIEHGATLEEALQPANIANRENIVYKDYLGNMFNSIEDMCREYGIDSGTYRGRLKLGWDLYEALTAPVGNTQMYGNAKACQDHLGNTYSSISALCREYGISHGVYKRRLAKGWELEEVLMTPVTDDYSMSNKKCKDHLGRKFDSIKDMCRHYGISVSIYYSRLNLGWDLGKVLTAPLHEKVTDHLGNEFDSAKEMCKAYRMHYKAYLDRVKNGWSVQSALETPLQIHEKDTDHLGHKFDSAKEMCKVYGVKYTVYKGRIKDGWSVERALSTPVRIKSKKVQDHLGHKFGSIGEMCETYGINRGTYTSRIKSGWGLEEALVTPVCKK